MHDLEVRKEKAVAVSVVRKGANRILAYEYLDELAFLADTAGAEVIEKFYQELAKPSSSHVLGKGKLEEIRLYVEENGVTLVIFDDDLSSAQSRNLENELKVKVLDRSGLILDIFACRAKTLEAKTQVDLAQMQYLLPRLTRMWTHLSKQYGGVGTRGPGETQIEVDRRMIRERIQLLKEKLKDISTQKEQQRKGRSDFPKFALVGYTNAGKSTLMNALTESDVYVEDKLFATLDTTVRSFDLPNGQKSLLSDTVGFIRKLPTHLVASFRSTLAEAAESDVLVHVVDLSHEYYKDQIKVVNETLDSLNIKDKTTILVFNKIDLLENFDGLKAIELEYPNAIFVSAKRGLNIQALLELFQLKYSEQSWTAKLMIPYEFASMVSQLYSNHELLVRDDRDEGTYFEINIQNDKIDYFRHSYGKFLINEE